MKRLNVLLISERIKDLEVKTADINADAVTVPKLYEAHGLASSAGLSANVAHGLAATPLIYGVISRTDGADLRVTAVNASVISVAVDVSGAEFHWFAIRS